MANKEAPNTLLSDGTLKTLDLICEGPISGFLRKNGAYGNDPLVSTWYDDVPVRNLDGSYNFNITGQGYSFNYTLGTAAQTGIPGYQKAEAIIPLSSNTRIANPPQGAGPFKPVIAAFNSNMFPDADGIKVTVRVPALMAQDDENNTNPYEIQYAVDISINNGAFVTVGNETIRGKCTSAYQKTTAYQLPKTTPPSTFYEWKVRIRRVSQNILSIRTQNEIFVDTLSVVSTSLYAYPNSVLVGTSINAEQFSSIPSRAYEIAGLLVSVPSGYSPTSYGYDVSTFTRQCDIEISNRNIGMTTQTESQLANITAGMGIAGAGIPAGTIITSVSQEAPWTFSIDQDPTATANNVTVTFSPTETINTITPATYPAVWNGTMQTGVWTDNPAWIYYDIMTNPTHGMGDYIQSQFVDKWSLYRISQYCDAMVDDGAGGLEPRFTCNVIIKQPQDAYTVLLNLASTFRGMLYYSNGAIHATQNQDESPVYAFNNANVIDGAFNYSDSAKDTRATVAKVKWVDPDNGYRENVEYIEDVDGILRYGYQEKEMTAFACTSKGQAYRLGSWTLQTERLLTETITFQTSMEGVAMRPGDNFAVYDNFRNNRAQAGRVVSLSPGRSLINLDRSVALEPGQGYALSCIVPKFQLDGSGDITGSSQIPYIRQSQVESFAVTTAATSGTSSLIIAGSFSTGIMAGAPFILAATGTGASVFNKASFYTCLATAEIEPGKIEILGLKANTGIQFAIQTGYTVVDWPENPGDIYTPIAPPSNLFVTGITGQDSNNTFYSSITSTWVNSPSPDLSYYIVSGKEWDTAYERFTVIDTGFNFTRNDSGFYQFAVAAVSVGGVESTYITGGFLVASKNPLGSLRPLSGALIVNGFDPLYVNAQGNYTGFVGINPSFEWIIPQDSNGLDTIDYQFISGYRVNAKSFDNSVTYYSTTISGRENTEFQFTGGLLRNFANQPRGFNFEVEVVDLYGGITTGANLKVNNPPMKAPFSSGFVGYNGGVMYSVTPSLQYDTSGIYLWVDQSPTFTPTYLNYDYVSSNLAGVAEIAPSTGSFYTWFALSDTFALSGNPIYGPISGGANDIAGDLFNDLNTEINYAINLITGEITQYIINVSGEGNVTRAFVEALSGEVVGTQPGVANNALNVRVNTIVVSASGSLSNQINVVAANVSTLDSRLGATGVTVLTALATTGGALAAQDTALIAYTSGVYSKVRIAAEAFVTGDLADGSDRAAVARWGFQLDANGKVVSMEATSASYGASYGTIVFGNADLQSNTFTEGSAGWRIKADGKAEFSDAIVRGSFTGGAGSSKIGIDSSKIFIGNEAGRRMQFSAGAPNMTAYNASNTLLSTIGYYTFVGTDYGAVELNNNAGSLKAALYGGPTPSLSLASDGSIEITSVGTIKDNADGRFEIASSSSKSIVFNTSSTQRWIIGATDGHIKSLGSYDIRKVSSDGWTVPLYDGDNSLEFKWDGALKVRIDGSTELTITTS